METTRWLRLGVAALCCALFSGVASAQAGRGGQVAGYRRDGTGIYPNCAPPTRFGAKDVAWTVETGWGHASPIVVGDRVLVQADVLEGVNDHPVLRCFSTVHGRLLWERELHHGDLVGDGGRATQAWHKMMQDYALQAKLIRKFWDAGHRTRKRDVHHPMLEPHEYVYDGRWSRLNPIGERAARHERWKNAFPAGGYSLEAWRQRLGSGTTVVCIGRGYPTPCSDGELVYATTGFGATFCYDLDGNLRWRHWVLCPKLGTEGVARSPIIHGNLLINDNDSLVRCYDRVTGRLLWKGPVTSRYIVSPMVLTIDKTDVLLTAQRAYRLPDGQPLKIEGWKDFGMQVLVKHDEPDVAFFCGAGEHCGWTNKGKPGRGNKYTPPAAVRFSLVGDTLKADVLWHGGDIGNNGGNAPWMLCLGDKFYHRNGAVLDALTGKVVAGRFHRRGRGTAVPQTGHLLCAANGHVYGMQDLRERKGQPRSLLVEVFTVDGRKVAGNTLPHIAGPSRSERWSYGHSFTFADRAIYIRAVDHLVKVDAAGGRPNGLTPVSLEDNRKLMAKGETGLGACTAARPAVR